MQNIKIINPKKAIGYNNIPDKLIRLVYKEFYVPIWNLRHTCIAMKIFLTSFKFSDVSRIFKSGDKMNKGNFCPVNIFSTLSTLNKGFLNDEMLDHFREIFDVLISAYRRHYSCHPHGLFVAKLHAYSFSMSACEPISIYLINRQ